MKLVLPSAQVTRITGAVRKAGRREVGGVLMGEHIGPDEFRISDLTIQQHGGTFATFVRLVDSMVAPLRAFFARTGHDYARFNYLGEWHSHHSFHLSPSRPDHQAMLQIVSDKAVGANFAVLLIVRLSERGVLEHSLTVYLPSGDRFSGTVVSE